MGNVLTALPQNLKTGFDFRCRKHTVVYWTQCLLFNHNNSSSTIMYPWSVSHVASVALFKYTINFLFFLNGIQYHSGFLGFFFTFTSSWYHVWMGQQLKPPYIHQVFTGLTWLSHTAGPLYKPLVEKNNLLPDALSRPI